MRFATFNLYQYAEPSTYWYERKNTYTETSWQNKNNWIRQQIEDMKADVIGFQEVFSVEQLKALVNDCGYPYFETVDEPATDENDKAVFIKPVVALASKYPINNLDAVTPEQSLRDDLSIRDDFNFSRQPISAEINSGDLPPIRVYVAHLKSKRPLIEPTTATTDVQWKDKVESTMVANSKGHISAMLQRGTEATALYLDAITYMKTGQPVVVLGDLNTDPKSVELSALTMQQTPYKIDGLRSREWPEGTKKLLHTFRLKDAFELAGNTKGQGRPFTHVFSGHGSTLDYILVSNALNQYNPQSVAQVTKFEVFNSQLNPEGYSDKQKSDHGQVIIELKTAVATENTPEESIGPEPALMTRAEFIDLAGGVFQAKERYSEWSGKDKRENFWDFFFDENYGWVKSVYGAVPINELHQKKRYSIEHIIPKSFLKKYLGKQNAPRDVINGATTNPFNFAACERDINSKRGNNIFDFDGDKIIRPYRLELNPDSYGSFGYDKDGEWVIPSHTRGDIARSILYMVLTYEINELYDEHLQTLIHWAKVDSPQPWELRYNEWVKAKHKISNPFIDTPEQALQLLNEKVLLNSTLVTG